MTGSGVDAAIGVDLAALSRWMDGQGLGRGPLHDVTPLTGGTQNILIRFERDGRGYVLRRPPISKRANSDETMRREARILGALAGTGVPHPALIAACDDLSVLGAAFYLMEPVDGCNVYDIGLPPAITGADDQHRLAMSMTDALAEIGAVDHVRQGLADLGRAENWHGRQTDRWRRQLTGYAEFDCYPGVDLPDHVETAAWLEAHQPTGGSLGLIHGDYHFANVLVGTVEPVIEAVIDWELATIGDPLLDLGHLLAMWPGSEAGHTIVGADGFPGVDAVIDRYAEGSVRPLENLRWFRVLAAYRLAVLLEGTNARAAAGLVPAELGTKLHDRAVLLCELAAGLTATRG